MQSSGERQRGTASARPPELGDVWWVEGTAEASLWPQHRARGRATDKDRLT